MFAKFLNTCEWVRWYNVAVINHAPEKPEPTMYVIAPVEGKEKRCLTEVNHFFLENEEYSEWTAIEFQGKIITGCR